MEPAVGHQSFPSAIHMVEIQSFPSAIRRVGMHCSFLNHQDSAAEEVGKMISFSIAMLPA
jgi:hypothetical protein